MSSVVDFQTQVLVLLREIRANQESPPFQVGTALTNQLGNAVGFVMALALSTALLALFNLIPIGKDSLLGKWLYAIFAVSVGLLLLYLLYRHGQPFFHRTMDK